MDWSCLAKEFGIESPGLPTRVLQVINDVRRPGGSASRRMTGGSRSGGWPAEGLGALGRDGLDGYARGPNSTSTGVGVWTTAPVGLSLPFERLTLKTTMVSVFWLAA